jgi:hypothetical protein
MVKAIHCWKPISKRPTGIPKTRWEDDVKKHTQKLKCQIEEPLSRIEEDGRNWLRRPKLCTKRCKAVIIRRITNVTSMKSEYLAFSCGRRLKAWVSFILHLL